MLNRVAAIKGNSLPLYQQVKEYIVGLLTWSNPTVIPLAVSTEGSPQPARLCVWGPIMC